MIRPPHFEVKFWFYPWNHSFDGQTILYYLIQLPMLMLVSG